LILIVFCGIIGINLEKGSILHGTL